MILFFFLNFEVVYGDINGIVTSPDSTPIGQVSLIVYDGEKEVQSLLTDDNGVFNFDIPPGQYTLIIYADELETLGADYVPAAFEVNGDLIDSKIEMIYGSSIILNGDLQFIDTEKLALKSTSRVQDASGRVLSPNGFRLEYSNKASGPDTIKEIPQRVVVVPSDTEVFLNVSGSFLFGSQVIERSFLTNGIRSAEKGEIIEIDIREYTVPISRSIASDTLDELTGKLIDMNNYGFYLTKQETAMNNGIKNLDDADGYFQKSQYSKSLDSLKKGYLLFTHTINELNNMYKDARFSVYVLLAFLTLASLITGYLLFENVKVQISADLLILSLCLGFFYLTYPGSKIIPITNFLISSVGFFITFIASGFIFPSLFKQGSRDGRVHTRNLIVPIFNIAKRSLRRRRLRFLLTFISISLLVTSFVTLTSFSEGYGLVIGKSAAKKNWSGVYIREGSWTEKAPTFISYSDLELSWIRNQPESKIISPKAETIPLRIPLYIIDNLKIYGVIGINSNEQSFIDIKGTLLEGNLPTEKGVLVSEFTSLEIGDSISLGVLNYTVEGVFSETKFKGLIDVDGSGYPTEKWVNESPEGETPVWTIKEAEPNEVLILDIDTALDLPFVGVQRIALGVNSPYNTTDFAERLALERGYLSWANSPEGYTSYRLGNYFQGKGASLVIPWIIVVLNVVITMLNSLFERRNEIEILSSVGLNPAQISAVFIAEAFITGFIAGGLGYLIGLGFYKGLSILNIGLLVQQKVSAIWSLAAIALAISAVFTGAYAALKNSIVITPSLMRRWTIDSSKGEFQEPWKIEIPIKLESEEVSNYLDFVQSELELLKTHHTLITSSIKRIHIDGSERINFIYKSIQTITINFYTKNTLQIIPLETGEYGAILRSFGEVGWSHTTGSLIRRITMDYSATKS
jgi:ABC-type antimicrobial peptide transport system permease subunit